MAFDISKLTSAVNRYLNSISEVSNAAKRANEEIAARTQFSTELGDAIRQNIKGRMRDQAQVPDISNQIQTEIRQATSGIDATIEQINGSFEAIREAGKVSGISESAKTGAESGSTADTGAQSSNAAKVASSNRDAYLGTLSTEALQELSRSQYFSANLIQSSLFDVLNENGEKSNDTNSGNSGSTASAFDSLSLSELNTNSLLKSAGLDTDTTAQTINGTAKASQSSGTDATDLAKALIKAYTNSGTTAAATSIFGDFTL